MAFAVWGATNSVAAAGRLVGGLLTQCLDRRWTFFVHLLAPWAARSTPSARWGSPSASPCSA
ncbi:hypothetical protein ACFV2S_11970 [Streptomyces sp. NPDC059695]|uniref:hypothetical protein n=1 Tax=Streptomyces sp. NPDC059695 TaxID=3346910 RepID=UPI0036855792